MVERSMGEQICVGIEAIDARRMTGWLTAGLFEDAPGEIEFFCDGQALGGTVPEAAGSGTLSFEFLLPRFLFDGAVHEFGARIGGRPVELANASHRLGDALAPPSEITPIGWVEEVSEDGWVRGWACYPDLPDCPVELEFLVDGEPAGSAIAGLHRPDVREAGIGGGYCGFAWPLPFSKLSLARDVTVSVREQRSGTAIPNPMVFRKPAVADAFSKIAELESDVRLLNETIAALARRGAADERATTELFRTVGQFFSDLAAASAAGTPLAQLRGPVAVDATAGLEPFALPACAAPEVTVFLEAGATVAATYEVLRAVRDGMGETPAEIFLIDDGACEDMPLLLGVVRHLRYARLPGRAPVARRNDAMRLAVAPVAVCLAAGVRLAPNWPDALAAFGRRPDLAVLAARVTLPDASLLSAGVTLQKSRPVRRGRWNELRAGVDAAAPECFAARRAAWAELAGLDEGYADMPAALVAFCLRARDAGHVVAYEPGFAAVLLEGTTPQTADFNGAYQEAAE